MRALITGLSDNVEHVFYFPEKEGLAEGIIEFATEHDADIIAVVPHRYGLLEGIFHKSTSKRLSFHTKVPLLALPESPKTPSAFNL
jgi:hypothetical protein